MPLEQIALVPYRTKKVTLAQAAVVAAAIQRQINRDFSPIWEVNATVGAFATLADVPLGYWPVIITDDIGTAQAAGFHEDSMGQPYSLVKTGALWSLSVSHECLEMLADPYGKRIVSGWRPSEAEDAAKGASDGKRRSASSSADAVSIRVEFLVEVCDPCEGPPYSYLSNGVLVSDFYTPDYFDAKVTPGRLYDFQGHIQAPRTVLPGGYLSWHDPDMKQWSQLRGFRTDDVKKMMDRKKGWPKKYQPEKMQSGGIGEDKYFELHRLESPPTGQRNIRAWIDSQTTTPQERLIVTADVPLHAIANFYAGHGPPKPFLGDESLHASELFQGFHGGVVYGEVRDAQAQDAARMEKEIDAIIGKRRRR